MLDSIPLVVVTGQVPLSAIGSDAFQECDTTGITMPVTKHNWLIQSASDIPTVVREAFHVATTGRPGPVLVDIPKDISNQTMEWYWPDSVDLPGFRAPQPPDPGLAREAARLILAAERPVIYAGGGILKARAAEAELAGTATIAPDRADWNATLAGWQAAHPLAYDQEDDGPLKPQFCIEQLRDHTPDDTIVVSGVGQHQMWSSQYWKFNHPYTWVNSGGLGTMGFAVPAAIGAKVGKPDRMVWAIDGDGCFQMTAQELVTATAERVPIKVAILNNAYLGMVRQWQEMFYEER